MRVSGFNSTQFTIVQLKIIQMLMLIRQEAVVFSQQPQHLRHHVKIARILLSNFSRIVVSLNFGLTVQFLQFYRH